MAYHHGNLRQVLLAAAVEAIRETGPAALSMRDLARIAGVSHAAPAHHFGDKAGLLTAVALEGYELLADALDAAAGDFLEVGVAYVQFAVSHPAHFEVMFHPALYRAEEVAPARIRAAWALNSGVAELPGATALAAWSLVHGLATLWLSGSIEGDAEDLAREVTAVLGVDRGRGV